MTQLEKAWAELLEELQASSETGRLDESLVIGLARAGFQAVLEAALEYDAKHRHREINAGCCGYHELQRRIEGLGK